MRSLVVVLVLLLAPQICGAGSIVPLNSYCLVDDFEGYTVVQWYLHNGAKYSFSRDAFSGNYSIRFSFSLDAGTGTHDSVDTQYFPLDRGFRVSLYFKTLNKGSEIGSPLYIVFDLVEAKVSVKWWNDYSVKQLSNGSYLFTHYFYIRILLENETTTIQKTVNYETRKEIQPDNLHYSKYRPTKWVHIIINYDNHNLTVTASNKTLNITVEHDPPSIKISIIPNYHYTGSVLIDKLEICGIKTTTHPSITYNIITGLLGGLLGGLIVLFIGSSSKRRRIR